MRIRTAVTVALAAVAPVASAGGYVVGRVVTLRPGDSAAFGQGWRCHFGTRADEVQCFVGDQTPVAELVTPTMVGPLTLRVMAAVGSTKVHRVRRRVCDEPTRCWYEDTYTFRGGAGG